MPVIQVEIDDDLHSDFKMAIDKNGLKIAFVIKALIRRFIKESNKEAK